MVSTSTRKILSSAFDIDCDLTDVDRSPSKTRKENVTHSVSFESWKILTQIHDHLLHIQIAKWEDSCVRNVFFGVSCFCFRGVDNLRNDYRRMISKELNTNLICRVKCNVSVV